MLHVVTGFPRTGTSAMLQLLEAGGIEAFANRKREERMSKRYPKGNPIWYELAASQTADTDFLHSEVPEDCAIKLTTPHIRNVPVRPMRLIWMHRDPIEIWDSAEKMELPDFAKRYTRDGFPAGYEKTTRVLRGVMEDRKSVKQIIDIQFRDLMGDPASVCDRIGIPRAAAAVINPSWREVA